MARERIGLALGSGGWKGLAHLGVLRALEELEIRPAVYAGASIGALVAAAAARQIQVRELELLAHRSRRRPPTRLDLGGLLRRGFGVSALFHSQPLRALITELLGNTTFRELRTPALIGTVDVSTGKPVWWGTAEHRDVSVADAVYASCAMPGFFPPGRVGPRWYMDGGIVDPLALGALNGLVDRIIVVDLDYPWDPVTDVDTAPRGSALWWSAQGLVMRDLTRQRLAAWKGPPVVVIRPMLRGVHALRATDPERVIRAGYTAARWALAVSDGEEVEASDSYPIG